MTSQSAFTEIAALAGDPARAGMLGLTIPPVILGRADEVIE